MRIVLIGPESTGKSTLCKFLTERFGGVGIDEYARTYIEQLGREYTMEDVETIAREQIEQLSAEYDNAYIFFDTDLVITKVWFEVRYGRCPLWVKEAVKRYKPDVYLVCMPDIAFVDDPVRENGDKRDELLNIYLQEIKSLDVPYYLITGDGDKRKANAISAVKGIAKATV